MSDSQRCFDCARDDRIQFPNNISYIITKNIKYVIPTHFQTDQVFRQCMTSINIPSSVEEVSSQAFVGCNQLQIFVVDSQNTKYRAESNCLIEIDNAYGDILLLAGNSEETIRRILLSPTKEQRS